MAFLCIAFQLLKKALIVKGSYSLNLRSNLPRHLEEKRIGSFESAINMKSDAVIFSYIYIYI